MSGKRNLPMALVVGGVLAAAMIFLSPVSVKAAEPGTWLVTVKPSYTDPETGKIEDPGNNEAIGQGMTEKLCGPTGLLEVDASGNTWLTVRYYLSQFVKDVTFEERRNGSYSTRPFQEVQVKSPVEGATDIDAKYGYSDYRISINSMDSVFRGKAYIEPMGRSVVYFFTTSNPLPGSGDFITTQSGQTGQAAQAAQPAAAGASHEGAGAGLTEEESRAGRDEAKEEEGETAWAGDNADPRGGGAADDPVTGIPRKPDGGAAARDSGSDRAAGDSGQARAAADSGQARAAGDSGPAQAAEEDSGEAYHLQTPYDLSAVPLDQARKLTKPILESATGITGVTGTINSKQSPSSVDTGANGNKRIMTVLLAIAAILIAFVGIGTVRQKGRKGPGQEHNTQEHNTPEHNTQEEEDKSEHED